MHTRQNWLVIGLLILGCACVAPSAALAQSGNWEYSTSLGGWLDKSTGLVWGERAGANDGGLWSWNGANNIFLPQLRAATGNPAWRLPTVAELQQAYANGAPAALVGNPHILPDGKPSYNWLWSSQQKGQKFAWLVHWNNGKSTSWDKRNWADAIPVYRAY